MITNTAIQEIDNDSFFYRKEKQVKTSYFFPRKKLSQLFLDLNVSSYLERAYCLKVVIEIAYSHNVSFCPLKIKEIYKEASVILNKNYNTIQSNVRLCIQDIVDYAPDELLHSVFYYNRVELKQHLYPKYFIIQILDYLNKGGLY